MAKNLFSFLHLGVMVAGILILLGALGYWVDQRLNTGYWFTLFSMIVAMSYVFYILWQNLKE